jgi:hypothetical protein
MRPTQNIYVLHIKNDVYEGQITSRNNRMFLKSQCTYNHMATPYISIVLYPSRRKLGTAVKETYILDVQIIPVQPNCALFKIYKQEKFS